jgi:transcriptional regulator with XRE-family HTH domain
MEDSSFSNITRMKRLRATTHDPQLHADGMMTKATLSRVLLELREASGLRSVDLAQRVNWLGSTVSRLEASLGRLPDLASIARYGAGCGFAVGLVFATSRDSGITAQSAVTLIAPHWLLPDEALFGQRIAQVVASSLVAARVAMGITQVELARRAGWAPQFVCRLESIVARMPNITSIVRYAKASGVQAGLVFGHGVESGIEVAHTLTVQGEATLFEQISGSILSVRLDPSERA